MTNPHPGLAPTPVPVPFHDHTLFVIEHDGEPYTLMRPVVEGMGLGWGSQSQKLNGNRKRWGVTMIVTPSNGGKQEHLCMPVRKLPGYLASINPSKVDPAISDRITTFQNECDDALWQYWSEGRTVPVKGYRVPEHGRRPRRSMEPLHVPPPQPEQPGLSRQDANMAILKAIFYEAGADEWFSKANTDLGLVCGYVEGVFRADPKAPIARAARRLNGFLIEQIHTRLEKEGAA